MPKSRARPKPRSSHEESQPAQPSWRRPPATRRKELRRQQASVRRVDAGRRTPAQPRAQAVRVPRELLQRWLQWGLLIVVVGCFVFGLLQLLHMPGLAVSAMSTQIGGARRVSPEQIYIESSIDGRNIFLIRPSDVMSRVKGVAGIASAEVHLRLPNLVLIDVQEHQPLVAWEGITATLWLAADGATVPVAGELPPLQLSDRTEMSMGESRALWHLVLPNLVELHAARPELRQVYYGKLEGIYFRAPEGWTVWLGDSGPVKNKLALLEAARREVAASGVRPQVIDLRFDTTRALWW